MMAWLRRSSCARFRLLANALRRSWISAAAESILGAIGPADNAYPVAGRRPVEVLSSRAYGGGRETSAATRARPLALARVVLPLLLGGAIALVPTPAGLPPAISLTAISPTRWSLLLGYPLGSMGVLTFYASGQSVIYYASGYISRRDFWVLGLVMGMLFIGVYLILITPWLQFLGY